ncbi:MAG: hypothetical protein DME91_09645 [Verrucomicrobia bacterium]|nr:MAG: hypothetical protein DME91_09645 [Verrucomicrobiota bacterium]
MALSNGDEKFCYSSSVVICQKMPQQAGIVISRRVLFRILGLILEEALLARHLVSTRLSEKWRMHADDHLGFGLPAFNEYLFHRQAGTL